MGAKDLQEDGDTEAAGAGGAGLRASPRSMPRIGYLGRGVAFLPLGFFVCEAGSRLEPNDAKNLGGVFQWLEDQPFGTWILFFIALGLIAFGLFALIEAWCRRIDVPVHN